MLWTLQNFKGIEGAQVDIRDGKATLLTGVNSSGKSSIIQSILLATQSLYSAGPVVLNGPLVRLGSAEDLVRADSTAGVIEFGISLGGRQSRSAQESDQLTAQIELDATSDMRSLSARRIVFHGERARDLPLVLSVASSRTIDKEKAIHAAGDKTGVSVLHFKSLLRSEGRQLRTFGVFQGMNPVGVVMLRDAKSIEKEYRSQFRAVANMRAARQSSGDSSRLWDVSPILVREFVSLLDQASLERPQLGEIATELHNVRNGNPFAFERVWNRLTEVERSTAVDAAAKIRAQREHVYIEVRAPRAQIGGTQRGLLESRLESKLGDSYKAICDLKESFQQFAQRVQYLGPLRDEPRVVWNHWNEIARGLPVGTRGEFTAVVLSRSKSKVVTYFDPAGEETTSELSSAVDSWLAHLEIGQEVSARSRGKLGVGFDLKLDGHVRDLTSVGVGVSQAIPLLVGMLSVPSGSVFIVEQPELHLHPAVQSRLADFMLSARPDISLIIETHSEAFITRIRRRVAEGRIDPRDVDIVFVEPTGTGSVARKLEVSKFGDLSEWPKGFLATSQEDVRAILRMSIARSSQGDPDD